MMKATDTPLCPARLTRASPTQLDQRLQSAEWYGSSAVRDVAAPLHREAAVRQLLCEELLSAQRPHSEAVWELWVPRSHERADVALIGDCFAGYEIKTERDTLKRLPRQAAAYGRIFDHCTVVVAQRHLSPVLEMIPDWWGAVAIGTGEDVPFVEVRSPGRNADVDPEVLVRLLWKDELRLALSSIGVAVEPGARRHSLWEQLLRIMDLDGLKTIVRQALITRRAAQPLSPHAVVTRWASG